MMLYSRFSPCESVSVTCMTSSALQQSKPHPRRRSTKPVPPAEPAASHRQMVRAEGLEPPRLSPPEPKSGASTSSATPATRRRRESPAARAPLYNTLARTRQKKEISSTLRRRRRSVADEDGDGEGEDSGGEAGAADRPIRRARQD